MRIKLMLLVSFLFLFTLLHAQHPKLEFESYATKQGLSNNIAISILQDKQGFLWIATEYGLSRFDGYQFENYYSTPEDSTSISDNKVTALYEDSRGELLIGTLKGFDIYDRQHDRFKRMFTKEQVNEGRWIRSFQEIKGGVLIVANHPEVSFYSFATGKVSKSPITDLIADISTNKNGVALNKIIIVNNNIYISDNTNFFVYKTDLKMKKIKVLSLCPFLAKYTGRTEVKDIIDYSESKILAMTYGKGMFLIDKTTDAITPLDKTYTPDFNFSSDLAFDAVKLSNHVWVATEGGINLIDQKKSTVYQYRCDELNPRSLLSDKTQGVFLDRQKNVWIAHFQKGINVCKYYNTKKFELMAHELSGNNSLSNNTVNSIREDKDGNLWIATDGGGVNFYNRKENKFKVYKNKPGDPKSLGSNAALCLHISEDGTVWVGSYLGGLSRYNKKTDDFTNFLTDSKNPNSINNTDVRSISEEKNHHIWMTTNGGGANLFIPEKNQFIHYVHKDKDPKSITLDWARASLVDRDGDIWLGTFSGLSLFNKKDSTFINYTYKDSCKNCLPTSAVLSLSETKDGHILIGTGAGLAIFDKKTKTFNNFGEKEGLKKGQLAVVEDNNGYIWTAGSEGLARLDTKARIARYFRKDDDLHGQEYLLGASYKAKDGRLYFGGINGVTFFYPDSIKDDPITPQIVFTNLKIFNKSAKIGEEINGQIVLNKAISVTDTVVLNHKNYIFSLEFAGIHLASPQTVQYMYKMDGLEKEWNHTTADRRFVSYTNLAPGTYRFMVKAANGDGIWSKETAQIVFIIKPPFWKTIWFFLLVVLVVGGSVISYYFHRINAIKQRNAELEKIVAERTTELKRANEDLQEQKEEILQQNEEISSTNDLLEQQHKQLESAYQNMELISEFGQKISSTLNFDQISVMIHDYIRNLVPIDEIAIGLYFQEGNYISWKYVFRNGLLVPSYKTSLAKTKDLATFCFSYKKEVVIPGENNEVREYVGNGIMQQYEGKSVICIPLLTDKKNIGILQVQNSTVEQFRLSDVSTIRSIAQYISFALDNAEAYELVREQNEHIKGSIRYAKNIQKAILPTSAKLESVFDNFVLYLPKDIVSGDFYWFTELEHEGTKYLYLAVVDCTGHGVPGAFMSLIGNRLLSEIVNERHIVNPSEVLDMLNVGINLALRQKESDNDDGMEISLCRFEQREAGYQLCFSSSKMAAYKYSKETKEVLILKGDRLHIGGKFSMKSADKFTQAEYSLVPGDCIYLSSDGIIDQSDDNRKRFGSSRLVDVLKQNAEEAMTIQKESLEASLKAFRNDTLQRDDITVIGIRIR